MISQTVEYSLRATVALAQRGSEPSTALLISQLTQVPAPYLAKVLQGLVRDGLVCSRRGTHGGFVLAATPDKLTIWDIVNAVEPFRRVRECPLWIGRPSGSLCRLHKRLDEVMDVVEKCFRQTTLAELLQDDGGRSPLCERNDVYEAVGQDFAENTGLSVDRP
jgi:Rrf2 family protein